MTAERIPLREYPFGNLASHVVGYTGQVSAEELEEEFYADYGPGDIIGWAGVEAHLRGVPARHGGRAAGPSQQLG